MEAGEGEAPPSRERKTFTVEGDLWDHQRLADIAGALGKGLLDEFSDLPDDEKAKKVDDFAGKIKGLQQETYRGVRMDNGKDLTIHFGEGAAYHKPTNFRNWDGLDLHSESIYHNAAGQLVDSGGRPLPHEGRKNIHNTPRMDVIFHPEGRKLSEGDFERIRKMQTRVVDILGTQGFGGIDVSINIEGNNTVDKHKDIKGEVGLVGIADIEFDKEVFGRGRGNIPISTSLCDWSAE